MTGRPTASETTGQDGRPRAVDERRPPGLGQARGVRQRRGRCPACDAARASAARSSGLASTSRTRGGHGIAARSPSGRPVIAERDEGLQERAEVLARVVAARIDEVPLGQAEALALCGEFPGRRRLVVGGVAAPERVVRPRRHRHDADAVALDVQQPGRGARRRLSPDDDGRGIADELGAQAPAEAAGGGPAEDLRHLPRGQVQERHDDRQPRRDRQRARAGGVVDGPGSTAVLGAPRRPDGGAHAAGADRASSPQPAGSGSAGAAVARRCRDARRRRSGRPGRTAGASRTTRPRAGRRRMRRAGREGRAPSAATGRDPGAAARP